jgi:type II secretory pathway component GspD/PulD (secretin)
VSETRIVSIARTLLMLVSVAPIAVAQLPAADIKAADQKPADAYQTFYLTNVAHPGDASELLTDLRNMLSPGSKAYYTPSQNAVSIRATPEEMLLARKIISDLDRAKKAYRLTYTITEVDGGKRAEARHVSLIVLSGEKAEV